MMHWGVNWKDGMKINADSFLKERRHTAEIMKLYARLHTDNKNYGRISSDTEQYYTISNNTLSIVRYEGISIQGNYIYVDETNNSTITALAFSELEKTYKPEEVIQIFLKMDIQNVNAFGKPDVDEHPVRMPHSYFSLSLTHAAVQHADAHFQSGDMIPIIRLLRSQSGLMVDKDYIAPVSQIRADSKLLSWFYELVNLNYQIAALNSDTIQRLSSDTHTSYLKSSITILCTHMAFFMANNMDEFADELPDKSPHNILSFYKKMGRIINASLVAMNNRERVIQYMADWTATTPEGFLEKLDALSEIEYNHANIVTSISQIKIFIKLVQNLFSKLSTLNYITEK